MVKFRLIKIPTYSDERGNLSSIELKDYVKWTPKRIYYTTDVKAERGHHAVRGEKKIYICMCGFVTVRLHDGKKWHIFKLKGPDAGIVVEGLCWREFKGFAPNTVLAAISNIHYDKGKYIYNFDEFLKAANDPA